MTRGIFDSQKMAIDKNQPNIRYEIVDAHYK